MEVTNKMVGRRTKASQLPPRLYEYKGKRRSTFYTVTHDNKRVNLGHDQIKAEKLLLTMKEERSLADTVAELLDDYLEHIHDLVQRGKRSARTLEDNRSEAVNLKKAFGKMASKDVQPSHVWAYLHKFRGKEAPVRANREVSFLQAAFNWGRGQGRVRDNPCQGVERNEETPRDRLVSDTEFDRYLEFCRTNGHLSEDSERKGSSSSDAGLRVALAAYVAYLTGKAQSQILRLHKTQITEEGILFGKRKRGAAVLVECTDMLRAVIAECLALPTEIETMFLITNRHGQPYTRSGFKSTWQRMQRAWEAAGNERFTFHDLRAKTVTDLIEGGRKASELTGHRTEIIPARVYDRRVARRAKAVK